VDVTKMGSPKLLKPLLVVVTATAVDELWLNELSLFL
jgi:hypothetical protein